MKSSLFTPFFMALLLFTSIGQATALIDVESLNQKLEKSKAGWIAKDTWLNHLTKAEAKRMMGLKDTPAADIEFIAPKGVASSALPPSIDWRNKDGKNWVSPILNQGNCGSCVAFAAIGVMETQFNISTILPNLNLRLSTQNLFACGGGGCNYGWFPQAAASYLLRNGVTDEACMPYTSGASGQDVACSARCADSSQRTVKISNYRTPSMTVMDVDSVKRALQNGPVVTTLSVYADFMTYAGGVYKHTTGEFLGGHAVSIVGYEDSTQSYIIRNSWGEDWGEQGFGHVAYKDTSGVGRSTWGFDIPPMGGAISVLNPRDYSYVTANLDFTAVSTFGNTDSLNYAVYDSSNKAVWSSICQGAECSAPFDSTRLPDGRYEVQVSAMNAHGDRLGTSVKQFFYVVNQRPALKLSFAGKGIDLKEPLNERIELTVSTQSSSVPMNALEFHIKDSTGKDTVRVANVVLNDMTTGWRTNLVPNGIYEIWMVGRVKSNSMDAFVETPHLTVTVNN